MARAVWLYVWELTILALHPFPTSVWRGGCGSRIQWSVTNVWRDSRNWREKNNETKRILALV